MSISKEEILNTVSEMSVMDVVELISMMEERFGVSASAAVSLSPVASTDSAVVEEKTEFDVVLKEIGANKVAVIKAVRAATGLGLKEAKDLVESSPAVLKEGISKDDAKGLKESLEAVGASVEVK